MKSMRLVAKAVFFVLLSAGAFLKAADAPTLTVKGYVPDSACAFTMGLSKTH